MYQFLATAGNSTSQDLEVASILAIGVGLVLLICFVLLIKIGLLWLTYDAANAADPDKQTMKPGFVWLLLIPLFNYYWNFVALPAVSDSLSATARGKDKDVGDAGRSDWHGDLLPVIGLFDPAARQTVHQGLVKCKLDRCRVVFGQLDHVHLFHHVCREGAKGQADHQFLTS